MGRVRLVVAALFARAMVCVYIGLKELGLGGCGARRA